MRKNYKKPEIVVIKTMMEPLLANSVELEAFSYDPADEELYDEDSWSDKLMK